MLPFLLFSLATTGATKERIIGESPTKRVKTKPSTRRTKKDVLIAATTNLKNPLLSISLEILFEVRLWSLSPLTILD